MHPVRPRASGAISALYHLGRCTWRARPVSPLSVRVSAIPVLTTSAWSSRRSIEWMQLRPASSETHFRYRLALAVLFCAVSILSNTQSVLAAGSVNEEPEFDLTDSNIAELDTLMTKSLNALSKVEGKEIILFVGNTGSGKSTLLNYMYGHQMMVKWWNSELEEITSDADPGANTVIDVCGKKGATFPIGHGNDSKTLFSQAEICGTGACLCDCPGFGENRGIPHTFATTYNLYLTSQLAKKVKGIVVMIPYPDISGGKAKGLKDLAQTLKLFLDSPSASCAESIFFVITKSNLEKKQRFLGRGKPYWETTKVPREQLITKLKGLSNNWKKSSDPDSKEALPIIQLMLQYQDHIISDFDPLDQGPSKQSLFSKLESCSGIEKGCFNRAIIGGTNRKAFQRYAIDWIRKGNSYFALQSKIQQSILRIEGARFILDKAKRDEIVEESVIVAKKTELEQQKDQIDKTIAKLQKTVNEWDIDMPIEHFRFHRNMEGGIGSFFSTPSCPIAFRGDGPYFKEVEEIPGGDVGMWQRGKETFSDAIDKGVKAAVPLVDATAHTLAAGLTAVAATSNPMSGPPVAQASMEGAKAISDRYKAYANDPNRPHLFDKVKPDQIVALQVSRSIPDRGIYEATASLNVAGATGTIDVIITGQKRHAPGKPLLITESRQQIAQEEKEIQRIDLHLSRLHDMSNKIQTIENCTRMIMAEEYAIAQYQEALQELSITEGLLSKINQLAGIVNRFHTELNVDNTFAERFVEAYNPKSAESLVTQKV